jgi:hypothetical protein
MAMENSKYQYSQYKLRDMKFKDFLKRTKKSNELITNDSPTESGSFAEEVIENLTPDIEDFVDPEYPDEVLESSTNEVKEPETAIGRLLNVDYDEIGFKDGYKYHSMDIKINFINRIISQMNLEIYREIEKIKLFKDELKPHLEILKENNKSSYHTVLARIQSYDRLVKDHELQISLINDEKGLVKKVIDEYEDGFTRGYELWLFDSKLKDIHGLL